MNTNLLFVLLQDTGSGIGAFLPLVLVAVVFYFFMIRPQTRRAKKQRQFRESMQKGDKVVTIGGIHGRIRDINETSVMLETDGGAKMRVEKTAISMEFSSGKGVEAADDIEQNK
jgi:preprotein translocase subunit YajC